MAWVLIFHVKETNYFEEENVIAPHVVEEVAALEGKITQEQLAKELAKEKAWNGGLVDDKSTSVDEKSGSLDIGSKATA